MTSRSAAAPLSDRTGSAADWAHARFKAMILDNRLSPGSQRLETELAAELGCSRTPVREALVRLEQEGLVEITPRHGMRVRALSAQDMRDIYAVLASLEPTAAEALASRRLNAPALAPLEDACVRMERAVAAEDRPAWAAADEDFHRGLVTLCGNRRLADMVFQVWDQSHRARLFTLNLRPLPARSTEEHRQVLTAIRAGDVTAAGEVWRAHRQRSGSELVELIERSGIAWL
jgi:DNA-binding GntR family transcriptional regulator